MTTPLGTELTPEKVASLSGGLVTASTPGLQDMIDAAVESIRRICGWHIFPVREETLVLDATGGAILKMPTLHVVDVSSVKINGVLIDQDAVDWSESGMLSLVEGVFPNRFRSVEVTLRHGFDSASDLLRVVAEIVKRGALAGNGGNITVGGISVGAPSGAGVGGTVMPMSSEWRVIDLYKIRDSP